MNTFKKKSLFAALTAFGALGVAGSAQAVYVNPDGLGQVLIYPYYTVRDKVASANFDSYLSVVNSTGSAKAVKVRFLEGRNSQEVLDFNLFLSAHDVWVAGVVPTGDGAGVFTPDKSCTVPTVSSDPNNPTPFVNYAYAGDGAGDTLDRTKEGYAEIIEMGPLTDGSKTAVGVTHVNGVPPCTGTDDTTATASLVTTPTGGLFGSMTTINVLSGEEFSANATALNAFRAVGSYVTAGNVKPDLQDADPAAVVFNGATGTAVTATMNTGIDAVSAVLMHDHLYNEFVLDSVTNSGTDWVVTMPTKRYYYNAQGVVQYLFQSNFSKDGACDDVLLGLYDREEFKTAPGFSPPPTVNNSSAICWEANVITFANSDVLGSSNSLNIDTKTFEHGWLDLGFPDIPASATDSGVAGHVLIGSNTFHGLPTIGFAVTTYNNGMLNAPNGGLLQSNYGAAYPHRASENVQ